MSEPSFMNLTAYHRLQAAEHRLRELNIEWNERLGLYVRTDLHKAAIVLTLDEIAQHHADIHEGTAS